MGLLLVLLYSSIVRFVPAIYNRAVFSNDAWPLIEITREISSTGRIPHSDVAGHHVKWPGSTIFVSIVCEILSVDAETIFNYIGVSAVSVASSLLVYAIVARVAGIKARALLATLGLSLFPSYTIYTSAFLKEVFSHAIMVLCLYFVLHNSGHRDLFPIYMAYTSLLISHPLSSLMIIAAVLSHVYICLTSHLTVRRRFSQAILRSHIVTPVVWLLLFYVYNALLVKTSFLLNFEDGIMIVYYVAAIYLPMVLLPSILNFLLATLLASLSALYLFKVISAPITWLFLPFIAPVILFLVGKVRSSRDWSTYPCYAISLSFVLPVVTIALYTITYAIHFLSILHRFLNYFVYGIAFLIPHVFSSSRRRVTVGFILVFALVNLLVVVACSLGLIPFLYYWRYRQEDIVLGGFITNVKDDVFIEGEPKYSYMISSIGHITPSRIIGICDEGPYIILSTDSLMYGIPVTPVNFLKPRIDLYSCRGLIYASKNVFVFGS